MPIDPSILAGAADASSNLFNVASNAITNRSQQKFAWKMYERQRTDALSDWNMQNAYNSPAAQMSRFEAAGLNKNLIYGRGNEGNSGPVRAAAGGSFNPKPPQLDLGSSFSKIYDIKIAQQQADNLAAQKKVIDEDALNKQVQRILMLANAGKSVAQAGKIGVDTEQAVANLSRFKDLYQNSLEQANEKLRGMQITNQNAVDENARRWFLTKANLERTDINVKKGVEEIALMKAKEQQLIPAEVDHLRASISKLWSDTDLNAMEQNARAHGYTWHDPIIQRMVVQKAQSLIDDVKGAFGNSGAIKSDHPGQTWDEYLKKHPGTKLYQQYEGGQFGYRNLFR